LKFEEFHETPQDAWKQILSKFKTQQVASFLVIKSAKKDLHVYIQLSLTSKKLDTRRPEFFNVLSNEKVITGNYSTLGNFGAFCSSLLKQNIQNIETHYGSKQLYLEFIEKFQQQYKAIQTPLSDFDEEECYRFLNLEQSTNHSYTDCPSKSTSLSSQQEREYQQQIKQLQEESFQKDARIQALETENQKKSYEIQNLMSKIHDLSSLVEKKFTVLEAEKQFLRQEIEILQKQLTNS